VYNRNGDLMAEGSTELQQIALTPELLLSRRVRPGDIVIAQKTIKAKDGTVLFTKGKAYTFYDYYPEHQVVKLSSNIPNLLIGLSFADNGPAWKFTVELPSQEQWEQERLLSYNDDTARLILQFCEENKPDATGQYSIEDVYAYVNDYLIAHGNSNPDYQQVSTLVKDTLQFLAMNRIVRILRGNKFIITLEGKNLIRKAFAAMKGETLRVFASSGDFEFTQELKGNNVDIIGVEGADVESVYAIVHWYVELELRGWGIKGVYKFIDNIHCTFDIVPAAESGEAVEGQQQTLDISEESGWKIDTSDWTFTNGDELHVDNLLIDLQKKEVKVN